MPDVAECLMTVQCAVLPGTDARELAGRLADAVGALPVPAAAGVGQFELLASEVAKASALAEKQGMLSDAASDIVMFLARLWYMPDQRFHPEDWDAVAIAMREHWTEMRGVHTGMVDVTVFPVGLFFSSDQWLKMARTCEWFAVTANAPEGLIPA